MVSIVYSIALRARPPSKVQGKGLIDPRLVLHRNIS
jgi:hypothetical protein